MAVLKLKIAQPSMVYCYIMIEMFIHLCNKIIRMQFEQREHNNYHHIVIDILFCKLQGIMSIIKNLLHNQRKLVKHSSKQFILSGDAINIPMGHVNNIPTIQFFR